MKITDEIVETAARAIARNWGLNPDDLGHGHFHEDAIAALTAVAPLIAAQALRHEADTAPGAWEVPVGVYHLDRTSRNYLRARAEQIEGGTTDADLEASLEWLESVAREREKLEALND